MSSSSLYTVLFAQVTNAVADASSTVAPSGPTPPWWTNLFFPMLIMAMVYFALIRPQQQAKLKADATIKGARTGDKIVTSSGIHGSITNVKDTTVIVKVADNVKLEIEKSHIDKIIRPEAAAGEKTLATKS